MGQSPGANTCKDRTLALIYPRERRETRSIPSHQDSGLSLHPLSAGGPASPNQAPVLGLDSQAAGTRAWQQAHLCPLLPGVGQWAWARAEGLPTLVFSMDACSIQAHAECGNHLATPAGGSDVGTGRAICPDPVIVCHVFGNQALPLSYHSQL